MKYIDNPPDAASLLTSARSFGKYDLAGALADLIDNSIKARATAIALICDWREGDPQIRILDNGHGMSEAELRNAMRPASTHPDHLRAADDLGRFGWGLKSASFSQCRYLTVLSRKGGTMTGAVWDLDNVENWRMGLLSEAEIRKLGSPESLMRDGTEVIWSNCDRLSENGDISEDAFNEMIVRAEARLALIFHRYLSGEARRGKLTITLNGQRTKPFDPYYREHLAADAEHAEELRIGNARIKVRAYIIPHFSKLRNSELEKLSGEEGLIRNQGFYVYRNDRLIMHGTWFGLIRHGELSQLARVSIDIPNTVDSTWKITVDKSDAQLPATLRKRLRQIVEVVRRRAGRAVRSKGTRLQSGGSTPVWQRHVRHGTIRYEINREHPAISALLKVGDARSDAFGAVLSLIEQAFPVSNFGEDIRHSEYDLLQPEANPERFRQMLNASVPAILADLNGNAAALRERLKSAEPYKSHWSAVEDYLDEKGLLA